jgi:hypothetical protein
VGEADARDSARMAARTASTAAAISALARGAVAQQLSPWRPEDSAAASYYWPMATCKEGVGFGEAWKAWSGGLA